VEITLSASYDPSVLAAAWMELESRADGGFFLSWQWIGTWLRVTGAKPVLVKASDAGTVMALGLLAPVQTRRHLLAISQLCLHETGSAACDAVMIEHNNFLMARSAPPDLATDIFKALQAADAGWQEIVLGGVPLSLVSAAEAAGLHIEADRISPQFGVDLSAGPQDWEQTLSANQRAQLRQSRAFAGKIGSLRLEAASDARQALDFFEKMVVLHTAYWQAQNRAGAFATEFSRDFHRELICAGEGGTELLALSAGDQVLGYLYNFRHGGRIYNYQSGFSYSDDNRHRPGLIAHAMAIQQAKDRRFQVYDFLAGDAPYKARLGKPMGSLFWCRAQKSSSLLRLESAARELYARLRGKPSGRLNLLPSMPA
jgi:CelD/BcsL family acetyltransferase involved in cellulose biosynthesis